MRIIFLRSCRVRLCHFINYTTVSRKRPPKIRRLSGRLQDLNHRESLPRRGPDMSTLAKIIFSGAMSKLEYYDSSMLPQKFFVYSK